MTVKEILQALVAIPVLGGQSNIPIAEWIEDYLKNYGIEYHLVKDETGEKRSIHCRIGPAVDGGVILSGHTDVVPVEGQDWHSDPFQLIEKDGKLYGRGSCDMKGFIACCLAALPNMLAAPLKKPIYFAFSYDEEVGCLAGHALAASIRETYEERPRFAIIGEPTSMKVVNGQKGMGSYETIIYSRGRHSSKIRTEASAIHEAAKLVLWLENKMEEIANATQDQRFDPPHSTMHVGLFKGGIAHNVIADKCRLLWDIRTLPSDDAAKIVAEFETFCKNRSQIMQARVPEFNIESKPIFPLVLPLDTADDADIINFVHKITGKNPIDAVSFASEAGQFAAEGFEAILCGPGSINQAHTANEFIEIEQLALGMEFMEKLINLLME
jgi:acetylornithine deacetylase